MKQKEAELEKKVVWKVDSEFYYHSFWVFCVVGFLMTLLTIISKEWRIMPITNIAIAIGISTIFLVMSERKITYIIKEVKNEK